MLNLMMAAPDPNPLTPVATEVVKNAKLNKAQWLILCIYAVLLTFILAYSFIPTIHALVPLTKGDIRTAFWLGTILSLLLCFLYALPDIIKKFKS